jgi:hypothetical protein
VYSPDEQQEIFMTLRIATAIFALATLGTTMAAAAGCCP